MSRIEHAFLAKLGDSWETATPGFCVQAFSKGKKIVDIEVGETYPFYDFASLTKLLFTTTAFMIAHDEKAFRLNDPVSRWVPWLPKQHPARIKDLLSHSAGMTWWYPFYQDLDLKTKNLESPEEAWQLFQAILEKQVLADIRERGTEIRGVKAVYSDVDYFLLGAALESLSQSTLFEVWTGIRERIGFEDTDFHRGNHPPAARKYFAPTETDSVWRKRILQGEVHDENTWALKGVAPHSGLFGSINDLSRWGLLLRKSLLAGSAGVRRSAVFPSPETVRKFTKRAVPKARGDWALGFMLPTAGSASCGPLFSPSSVGHTGFTGTSIWLDPKHDLLVSVVSNRVHPTRENREFVSLRPKIHTWIAEEL